MNKYILIPILMFSISISANATNLYQKNYDKFWGKWWASQKLLISCKSPKNTTAFIINALSYLGNSEVTEANAEEIEKLAIKKPACLVEGLSKLNNVQLKKFNEYFIKQAIFYKPNKIISSIKKDGKLNKFPNVQKLFK
jgi:hypothetical protein